MQVKRYQARSIQDAVERIKEDLGPNAMILSTKRVSKGPGASNGRDLFEVMAVSHKELEKAEVINKVDEGISALKQKEEKKPSNNIKEKESPPPLPPDLEEKLGTLKTELISIKDMLFLMNHNTSLPDLSRMQTECINLYARLVRSGISERRVHQFMKSGGAFSNDFSLESKNIISDTIRDIYTKIKVLSPFDEVNAKPALFAFIGPTGVGKTTTIAKLAAELSLKQKKSVGIISIDGYRIAAVEQLKTYAAIMGLPCLPAFTAAELKTAIEKIRSKDVILIDTAGQSHLDKDRINELGKVIEGEFHIDTHLVLSANTKREDMKEAAENFRALNPASYIFTKVDETRVRGGIIDQIMDLDMPISYISYGQNVPDDITVATKKNVLKLILS